MLISQPLLELFLQAVELGSPDLPPAGSGQRLFRFIESFEFQEHIEVAHPVLGNGRVGFQGLFKERDSFGELTKLYGEHAKVVVGIRVLGLCGQNRPVQLFGFLELAGFVSLDALLEGFGNGEFHGRLPVGWGLDRMVDCEFLHLAAACARIQAVCSKNPLIRPKGHLLPHGEGKIPS